MAEPVTTITVATLTAVAASKFVERATEKAMDFVGPEVLKQAGGPVAKLWDLIKQKFAGNSRAEEALAKVEAGDEGALTKLEVYLDDELADSPELKAKLLTIVAEIQALKPEAEGSQQMLVDVEADDIKAKNLKQRSQSDKATEQVILDGVKAKTIELGDLTQEQ